MKPGFARALRPGLPRAAWIYEVGGAVDALGRGVTAPFLFIYLHDVRGFSYVLAGAVLASFGLAGLAGTFVGGALSDRFDPRGTLIAALVLTGASYCWLALVERPWQAFVVMVLSGLGYGAFRTSNSTCLAALSGDRTLAAFSISRLMDNLGLGLGALVGGLIASTSDPSTFRTIFFIDGATSLAFAALVTPALLRSRSPSEAKGATAGDSPRGRYRDVLGQRTILAIVAINTAYVCAGYALYETALPIFAKDESAISERGIGLLFLMNAFAVVLFQLPATQLLERRGFRAASDIAPIWAAAWTVVLLAGIWFTGPAALTMLVAAVVLFAAGECALAVHSAAIAELAPPRLRARCLGLIPASYAVGLSIGPALVGLGLSLSPFLVWPVAIGAILATGAYATTVGRRVAGESRGLPAAAAGEAG